MKLGTILKVTFFVGAATGAISLAGITAAAKGLVKTGRRVYRQTKDRRAPDSSGNASDERLTP